MAAPANQHFSSPLADLSDDNMALESDDVPSGVNSPAPANHVVVPSISQSFQQLGDESDAEGDPDDGDADGDADPDYDEDADVEVANDVFAAPGGSRMSSKVCIRSLHMQFVTERNMKITKFGINLALSLCICRLEAYV